MRILLDTNVWRYIVDEAASDTVVQQAVKTGSKIVVAPSVIYETLAMADRQVRNSILKIQANRQWLRLMPEAFYECEELKSAIARLRRIWLSTSPKLQSYRANLADWRRDKPDAKTSKQRGFWGRLTRDTDRMAEISRFPFEEEARQHTRESRRYVAEQKVSTMPPLDDVWATPIDEEGKPLGERAEAWRWKSMRAVEWHLGMESGPYHDWLAPFLRRQPWLDDRPSWEAFWLEEVDSREMVRHWLRWACEHLQQLRKWTPGTPADSQLAAYLIDAHLLVSADKALIELVNEIERFAPRPTAKGVQIPAGSVGVQLLLAFMRENKHS